MTNAYKHERIYRYLYEQKLALIEEEKVARELEKQLFHLNDQRSSKAALEARKFAAINHADNLREEIKRMGEEPCA